MAAQHHNAADLPPIARSTDPSTSKEAAASYTAGKRVEQKQLLLDYVARHPGHTAREYAHLMKDDGVLDWYTAARIATQRLSDLIADESVRRGDARKCQHSTRRASTYYPVDS